MNKPPEIYADYLIIGNSVAAIAAVETIRETDVTGKILILTKEPKKAYSRPLISYFLGGKVGLRNMQYRSGNFYTEKNCEVLAEKEVVAINPAHKTVKTADGLLAGYNKLFIATGGLPIRPSIEGSDADGIFNFTTLDDAKAISSYIKENKIDHAVILGGGLIGLKAAEALLALNKNITIIELADRILSTTFDTTASKIIEDALTKQGCRIVLRDSIKKIISQSGRIAAVELVGSQVLQAELLIVAVGVRPAVGFLTGSGIQTKRGILVDERMATNVPDIYAAGDVVEAAGFFNSQKMLLAIWPDAYRQGRVAGAAMTGRNITYKGGLPMNSVELAGIPTISVGLTDPQEEGYEVLQKVDFKKSFYKKIVLKDNVIQGLILVGNIDRAGVYTGLIRDRLNTAPFRDELLSNDFGIISLPKEYRKHMVTETPIEI